MHPQNEKHRGVEQLVARQAHNLEVARSSPASATQKPESFGLLSFCSGSTLHVLPVEVLHQGVECFLLSYHPDDIAFLETVLRTNGREIFLALFQSDDHAAVVAADATLLQRLAHKGTSGGDDELAQLHLVGLRSLVIGYDFALKSFM